MCCRFDLLANGGASLTLSFERAPFLTQYRTVWVPWNVFYVMDTLVMKKVSGVAAVCLDVVKVFFHDTLSDSLADSVTNEVVIS